MTVKVRKYTQSFSMPCQQCFYDTKLNDMVVVGLTMDYEDDADIIDTLVVCTVCFEEC